MAIELNWQSFTIEDSSRFLLHENGRVAVITHNEVAYWVPEEYAEGFIFQWLSTQHPEWLPSYKDLLFSEGTGVVMEEVEGELSAPELDASQIISSAQVDIQLVDSKESLQSWRDKYLGSHSALAHYFGTLAHTPNSQIRTGLYKLYCDIQLSLEKMYIARGNSLGMSLPKLVEFPPKFPVDDADKSPVDEICDIFEDALSSEDYNLLSGDSYDTFSLEA